MVNFRLQPSVMDFLARRKSLSRDSRRAWMPIVRLGCRRHPVTDSLSLIAYSLILATIGCLVIASRTTHAQDSAITSASPHASAGVTDFTKAIEKLEAAVRHEVEHKDLPAFSISLVDDHRVVWADGFGFQDAEKKVPATAQTVYRVGSISKLFTDIAVMQLVERGELDLDVPIDTYVPEFSPENASGIPITLRQMMSHRSGLVRESPVGNYFDPTEPTLRETVASLNETKLVYQPETKTKYSNAAIAVVGAVVESKLDVSHPERVRQSILEPLNMTSSSFVVTPVVAPKLATGWMHAYDGRRPFAAPTFLLGTGPAGNLYSSVEDLSKFLVCMFDEGKTESGQLVRPETYRVMTTPLTDDEGKPQGFGIGFHVQELDGYKKIGHGGAVYGFSTQLEALPERRLGVVAAASLDGTNGVVQRLADYALRLMIAAQDEKPLPEYRTTASIPPQRARELIGAYHEVDGDGLLHINELAGDVLMQYGSFRRRLGADRDDGRIVIDDEFGYGTEVVPQQEDRRHGRKHAISTRWRWAARGAARPMERFDRGVRLGSQHPLHSGRPRPAIRVDRVVLLLSAQRG